jgi:hypothetical protein
MKPAEKPNVLDRRRATQGLRPPVVELDPAPRAADAAGMEMPERPRGAGRERGAAREAIPDDHGSRIVTDEKRVNCRLVKCGFPRRERDATLTVKPSVGSRRA